MTMIRKIDLDTLREIPNKSNKNKVLMQALAERDRGRQTTSFHRIKRALEEKSDIEFTMEDYNNFFNDMQSVGAGVLAGHGKFRTFKWHWNLCSVAKAAVGIPEQAGANVSEIKPQTAPKIKLPVITAEVRSITPQPLPTSANQKVEVITIRNVKGFEIDVPIKDVNNQNCKKIVDLLKNLAESA